MMMNNNILIKLNRLEKKTESIENELKKIDNKLTDLIILMNDNKRDCEKMSSHIDFIDNVYQKLKTPIDYVCKRLE
jgi:predicted  nucleic acid-binding Zn-ribbon protein